MGDGSCLAAGVRCYNVAPIELGASSVVSQFSYLCAASHDPHDAEFPLIGGPIRIGKGAWVAADAFVSPGIEISDYAVVAARAVAVRHVSRRMIVGGNPARVIGRRNSPDQDQEIG
jgi:putative colanic acid biosynthesis acetyltransferase WcaF